MPVIFDDDKRKLLRKSLLENGFELIKKYGYKKTSVEQIASSCGIAKGTFYNFFDNKESFVYEILLYKRNIVKDKFKELTKGNNKLNKSKFKEYIEFLTYGDNNLMIYLTDSDINMLRLKWADDALFNQENDRSTSMWILNQLEDLNSNVDWRVFANYCKSIAILQHNKNILYEDVLNKNFDRMINDLTDYLFAK